MRGNGYDIVAIGDFRFPGGASSGPAEQIRAQALAGYRTALIQMKGPVLRYPHPFNPRIRDCIDKGYATLVDPCEPISASLAVAFHPQVFTHPPARALAVDADTKILVASHPLVDGLGQPYYDWRAIDANVQEALGGDVKWSPLGPLVRAPVARLEHPPPLTDRDWLEVVDLDDWAADRSGFCDGRPVIGRHSRPDPLKWPDDKEAIFAAYPDDPACQVRILGAGDFLNELIGPYPRNWEAIPFNAIDPREFLRNIDFFVYFHHSRWVEALGRVIIEAMASGALAILPPVFEPLCGEGAIYGETEDVRDLIAEHYLDHGAFTKQTSAADQILRERFSPEAHIGRIENLIGGPRPTNPVALPPVAKNKHRVLFLTSNGVGMGHLTRMLAIARRCSDNIEPVIVTMSQAMRMIEDYGFIAEYIPFHGYLKCDPGDWNHFLREEINELIGYYEPKVLMFDGNVAYGGLVSAIRDNPTCFAIWCRRAMWRPSAASEGNILRESAFHAVIEPGEIAAAYDAGLTTEYRDRTRTVDPIRLLDDEEMLSREEARAELGLDPERLAVLLQLGSENNFDYNEVRAAALDRLFEEPDLQVAAVEWLISAAPVSLPKRVMRLSLHPIGRYHKAFDFVISAAGYNSYHELILAGIPTIFVANENPTMDEQLTRAQFAERNGLGLCLRTRDIYNVRPYIDRMLDAKFRAMISARCAGLARGNGAFEAAEFVEELTMTLHADREPRGYWQAR